MIYDTSHCTNVLFYFRTLASRMFTCNICDRHFININGLNAHKGVHVAVKRFSCEVCNKQFTRSKTLNAHKNVYHNDGAKPFNCDVCKKAFISNSDLTKHKRIHTGEKPFSCIVCLKTFAQPGHLTSHLRIHTGERPFKCSECDKTFSASSSLDKHKRSHTGEKPYYCNVCYKSFNSSSWLSKHNRTERHLKKLEYANSIGTVSQTMPLSFYNGGDAQFKQEKKKEGISPEDFLSVQMEADNVEENGNHPKMLDDGSNMLPTNPSINFVDCGEAVIKQEIEEEEFLPGVSDQMEADNFLGGTDFTVQKKVIKKEKQYPCYLCQKSFNSSSNLSRHKKTIQHLSKLEAGNGEELDHGETVFKEEIEEDGFSPENFLSVHMETDIVEETEGHPNESDDCGKADFKQDIKEERFVPGDFPSVQMEADNVDDTESNLKNMDIQANTLTTSASISSDDCGEADFKQDIQEERFIPGDFPSGQMEADNVEQTESNLKNIENQANTLTSSSSVSSEECSEANFKQEVEEERFCPADFPDDDTESNLKNIENQANTLTNSASNSSVECCKADFKQEIKEERCLPGDFPPGQMEADNIEQTNIHFKELENHSNAPTTSSSISSEECGEADFKQEIKEERCLPGDFPPGQMEADNVEQTNIHFKELENHSNAPTTSSSISSEECGEADFKQEIKEEICLPGDFTPGQMEADNAEEAINYEIANKEEI